MSKLTDKRAKQSPVAASDDRGKQSAFYDLVRNRLSKLIARMRSAPSLRPLHKRYGPIKYNYVLPAFRKLKKLIRPWGPPEPSDKALYQMWVERSDRIKRERAIRTVARLSAKPTISIILPVFNTPQQFLRDSIDSVLNQYYENWELSICDDASTAPHVRQILDHYSAADKRIKVVFSDRNGGISQASNRALSQATGEFVGLLDHDDLLTPDALAEVALTIEGTGADMIYTDEDRMDSNGRRVEPAFKPAWSPDLLMSCMYTAHFSVYRKTIIDRIGGFRSRFDGSQDYDLALRFTEQTNRVAHIPKILYHWRKVSDSASAVAAEPSVIEAGKRALNDAIARRGIEGEVQSERFYGFYRVKRKIIGNPKVSILIATRDGLAHLRRLIASIESKTDYKNYEIVIVDNDSRKAATLDYLKRLPHYVIRDEGPFNHSRLNNLAALEAAGDYLLFLNDDTEVISAEWLRAMLEQAQRAEVGAVGAKLLYRDARIQHAGIILGLGGAAGHAHRYVDGFNGRGYLNYPNVVRNYSAVTGACLMTRRAVFFDEAGGFDEQAFPVSFNDVDFCLRLRKRGYLVIFTPYALLYHHESATRGLVRDPKEVAQLEARWQRELASDYYYNPNLVKDREDFSVDFSEAESLEQFRLARTII